MTIPPPRCFEPVDAPPPTARIVSSGLCCAVLLAAATLARAHEFDTWTLAHTGTGVPVAELNQAIALDNGDIVLHESSAQHISRYSRFDASGRIQGATSFRDERFVLGTSNANGLVSAVCNSRDISEHSADGQLRWRFVPTAWRLDCDWIEPQWQTGIDRDGRLWVGRHRTAGTVHAESGQVGHLDFAQTVAADTTELRLFAWPSRSGAVLAAGSASAPQFAAIDATGSVLWRHQLPAPSATNAEWELRHELFATSNRSGAVALTDFVGQWYDNDIMSYSFETLGVHIAVLDSSGRLIWRRDANEDSWTWPVAQHLFDDGTLAVMTLPGLRMRLFAADGSLLTDHTDGEMSWGGCHFVAPRGRHWAICTDYFRLNKAISLDGGSSRVLTSIGIEHLVRRTDGSALIFEKSTPPFTAEVFDGSNASTMIDFTNPNGMGDSLASPMANRALANGDQLLLLLDGLSRVNRAGDVLWTRPLPNTYGTNVRGGLIAGDQPQLLLVADQVCLVRSDPQRRVLCYQQDTGNQSLSRLLSGTATEKVWVIARNGALELLFRDAWSHVQHWLLSLGGELLMSRDLGAGTTVWLDADGALAQRQQDGALITSDLEAAAPVVHPLPADSPLRTEQIVNRIDRSTWLSLGSPATSGATSVQVRVHDASFRQIWLRDFPVAPGALTLVSTDAEYVKLMLRDSTGARQMQFLSATTGEPVAPALAMPNLGVMLRGPAGAFGMMYGDRGTIVWRTWDALGRELGAHAWRCPKDCGSGAATTDGGRLYGFTSGLNGTSALTLEDAFAPRRAPHGDDGAIAGVFTAANETNRGYVIDWLPSSRTLFVARFAGDTSNATRRELLDWETMQGTVSAGASEITLSRYRTADGRFAAADDATTTHVGSATFRFDGCDAAELVLTDTSGAQPVTEVVQLLRSGPRMVPCALLDGTQIAAQATRPARGGFDTRQSGAWVAAGASDQGLLAAVLPATADGDGVFFAPWFTYWTDAGANPGTANRHWLVLQGALTPASNGSAALTIYRATAGSYGSVRPSDTHRIGTATWTLVDCEHATLDYQFDPGELARPYAGRSGVQFYARPGACSGGP
ncbi:MAG: hypothetical protein HYV17_04000 [Xanthomonadales bacterium]|nr:hypothetical protein [Xanthomonadales bacterium]